MRTRWPRQKTTQGKLRWGLSDRSYERPAHGSRTGQELCMELHQPGEQALMGSCKGILGASGSPEVATTEKMG